MDHADKLFTDGGAYERLMGRWSRVAGRAFLGWLDAPSGLRWLDVGCGNGAFTQEVIACCAPATIMGVDPSEDQLTFARTRVRSRIADFRVGDAQNLLLADRAYDVAAMALVISFLHDPEKAVSEMAGVVRPGGLVASYMWDVPGGGVPVHPIYLALESMGFTSVRPPNPAASELSTLQKFWRNAGLECIETTVIDVPTDYSNFEDFWNSNAAPIGPQGKVIASMSVNDREDLRKHLRDCLPVSSDGRIYYKSFANAVKGRVPA